MSEAKLTKVEQALKSETRVKITTVLLCKYVDRPVSFSEALAKALNDGQVATEAIWRGVYLTADV